MLVPAPQRDQSTQFSCLATSVTEQLPHPLMPSNAPLTRTSNAPTCAPVVEEVIAGIDKGGQLPNRTLSRSHRNANHHPRHQQPYGRGNRLGDWHRHGPL
jgi:hypothetical protein